MGIAAFTRDQYMSGASGDTGVTPGARIQKLGFGDGPRRTKDGVNFCLAAQKSAPIGRKYDLVRHNPGGPLTSCHIQTRKP